MTFDSLHTMSDRELYRLAFDVSEVLTEREMMRQYGIIGAEMSACVTPAAEYMSPGYSVKVT